MPATHSLPCSCLRPSATASKSVAAVTSTVWATPSMSAMVTRQDRISIARKYHIRFLFAIWFWVTFALENNSGSTESALIVRRDAPNWIPCKAAYARAPFSELAHLYYHCCDKRFGADRSKRRGNDHERDATRIYSADARLHGWRRESGQGASSDGEEARKTHQGSACGQVEETASAGEMVRAGNRRALGGYRDCRQLADSGNFGRARHAHSSVRSGRMGDGDPLRKTRSAAGRGAVPRAARSESGALQIPQAGTVEASRDALGARRRNRGAHRADVRGARFESHRTDRADSRDQEIEVSAKRRRFFRILSALRKRPTTKTASSWLPAVHGCFARFPQSMLTTKNRRLSIRA